MLALILERIIGYRKKVIVQNIKNSFPHKTADERKRIKSDFYKHFVDIFIESLKSVSISKDKAKETIRYENIALLNDLYAQQKDVIIVLGHIGNWEKVCTQLPLVAKHKILGVYKPLKNKFFDKKVKQIRSRFGLELVAMQDTNKKIKEKTNQPKAILLIGDQSPSNPNRAYWTKFLNQDTSLLFGAEKLAKIYDMPVLYLSISKTSRASYLVKLEPVILDDIKVSNKGIITEAHTQKLEDNILHFPHLWLWSHRRWKHKK